MPTIDEGTIHVLSFKDGVLSRLGHDVRLSLGRFEIAVEDEAVSARFWTGSFAVDGAIKRGELCSETFSAKDRREIIDNLNKKVLQTTRYPDAHYTGRVREVAANRLRVEGTLELVGRRVEQAVDVEVVDGRLRGRLTLTPTRWGIQPFKALLGALRVQDRVEVTFDLPDPR
jgi:polyisoprenoid-binding protein YceI